ncbi:hypothetical protein ASPCADRAFT_203969 [Aspergillus carbonarius ITEM 5010]|uniref:Uncharacterized protein n=1 Tax=Aspergillus carbonarius (strain ITEM 5010) TaxID=602072 RepID=A0A1R3S052_ASPC5|nr:hypothetical protein ASPCADRAFT_203969 [Aspergillus carbonarius ITEM 5010]
MATISFNCSIAFQTIMGLENVSAPISGESPYSIVRQVSHNQLNFSLSPTVLSPFLPT